MKTIYLELMENAEQNKKVIEFVSRTLAEAGVTVYFHRPECFSANDDMSYRDGIKSDEELRVLVADFLEKGSERNIVRLGAFFTKNSKEVFLTYGMEWPAVSPATDMVIPFHSIEYVATVMGLMVML